MTTFATKTQANTTAETLLGTFEFDAKPALKKIDLPCLIIAAKDDRLIDPKTSLQQKLIRGSELVIVNG